MSPYHSREAPAPTDRYMDRDVSNLSVQVERCVKDIESIRKHMEENLATKEELTKSRLKISQGILHIVTHLLAASLGIIAVSIKSIWGSEH